MASIESRKDESAARGARGAASDAELGRRARTGDREAFGRIYERHAPAVHGVLVALAPWRDAHDLVQDVFLLALRSIDALDDPERLGPWLLSIARNRARDHLRAAGTSRRSEAGVLDAARESSDEREPARAPVASADDEEEARGVLEAIRALPPSYRETLALRLVEGLSGPQIAERTGLTHGSVRVNLTRGMKLLRERLEARESSARARKPAP